MKQRLPKFGFIKNDTNLLVMWNLELRGRILDAIEDGRIPDEDRKKVFKETLHTEECYTQSWIELSTLFYTAEKYQLIDFDVEWDEIMQMLDSIMPEETI